MNTYILVAGSWHSAWCWYKIIPQLERAGHLVIAVDLPAHGRDTTPASAVTLQSYVDHIVSILDTLPGPAILVGHSRAGIVISQSAEARPDKIKALVYLAAYLIPHGETMLQTALADTESLIAKNLELNEAGGYHTFKHEAMRDALYADCNDDDVTLASLMRVPEPNAPVATPLHLTADNYGRVPRVYIETLKDQAVTIGTQRRMVDSMSVNRLITMDSSHSPFFSQPAQLAAHLMSV